MQNEEMKKAGELIMQAKRTEPFRWDDTPMYKQNAPFNKPDSRTDLGYAKATGTKLGNIEDIRAKRDKGSALESPLKRWWLEQERLKQAANEKV